MKELKPFFTSCTAVCLISTQCSFSFDQSANKVWASQGSTSPYCTVLALLIGATCSCQEEVVKEAAPEVM